MRLWTKPEAQIRCVVEATARLGIASEWQTIPSVAASGTRPDRLARRATASVPSGRVDTSMGTGRAPWQPVLVLIDVPHGGELDPRQLRG